jgi:putrescine transport system permease protein
LPLVIFSRARLGVDPSVNAVATVVIAVVSMAVLGGSYALARAERRRSQEVAQAARAA